MVEEAVRRRLKEVAEMPALRLGERRSSEVACEVDRQRIVILSEVLTLPDLVAALPSAALRRNDSSG